MNSMNASNKVIKPGMMMLWYGTIANIPVGWHLCDGDAGTPDLQDRFVICAGNLYGPGNAGGSATHNHDFTATAHAHYIAPGYAINGGNDYGAETYSHNVTGTTDGPSAMPPYYALAYIVKL